jgi:hypothetical protein
MAERIESGAFAARVQRHRDAQRRYREGLRERGAPDSNAIARAALAGLRAAVAEERTAGKSPSQAPKLAHAIGVAVGALMQRGYSRPEARKHLLRALSGRPVTAAARPRRGRTRSGPISRRDAPDPITPDL